MASWLANAWYQIWPNLAAQALWSGPIWVWHHKRITRKLTEHLENLEKRLTV